jgi:hypothetical protein
LRGQLSIGDWRYNDNVEATIYDDEDQSEIPGLKKTLYLKDVKVGNAAQLTWSASAKWYTPIANLSMDMGYNHIANLYSNLDASSSTFNTPGGEGAVKLPNFWLMDLGISYSIDIKKEGEIRLRANINNLLNTLYINNMSTNIHEDTSNPANNWNGLNMNNQIAWGMGRTWNVSAMYVF